MKLDPKKTALLTLDCQMGIFGLGFSEGYPEIPDVGSSFKRVKDNNLFVEGLQAGHEVIGRSVVHIRN